MRIPQKIDYYFDEHTCVSTNICARILDRYTYIGQKRLQDIRLRVVNRRSRFNIT